MNCIPGRHASEVEEEAELAVVLQRDLGGGIGAQRVRGTLPGLHDGGGRRETGWMGRIQLSKQGSQSRISVDPQVSGSTYSEV